MRKHTKILAGTVVLATAGWFAGCNGTIDKEPNVVLEVAQMTIPIVSTSQDSTTGTCTYTITAANATFNNKPKNSLAIASPFNDILLQSVDITYAWDDFVPTPVRTAGLGGAVPAGGTTTGQFSPVANADLNINPPDGRAGHTASLSMTFRGVTVSGDAVSTTTGGTLQINSCTVNVGACCTIAGGCDTISQAACTAQAGTYKGDNTSCSTSNICL